MKKKQVIRLTESDLHRVINESVKQVLSELDWKTYNSAYEKQASRGYDRNHPSRDNNFKKAAQKAFNDQFAYEDENGYYIGKVDGTPINTNPYLPKDFHTHAQVRHKDGYGYDTLDYGYNEPRYENGYDGTPSGYYNLNHRNIDDYYDKMGEVGKKARIGNKEMENYRNGNYEYQKGKGWQKKDGLDESIRRAIRKVLH